jgi:hypothetical protein
MYDRDILALQVGASLTPSDTYLIQLLHKFNLLEWVRYVMISSSLFSYCYLLVARKMVIHLI